MPQKWKRNNKNLSNYLFHNFTKSYNHSTKLSLAGEKEESASSLLGHTPMRCHHYFAEVMFMEKSVSELRKKSHTKNLITHPALLTLEYKAKQIKLLIQSALDCQIGICTRVDIVSPNGINTSADFRLTPEQVKLVWQAKPQAITLYLKPPEHLTGHLPEIFEAIVTCIPETHND